MFTASAGGSQPLPPASTGSQHAHQRSSSATRPVDLRTPGKFENLQRRRRCQASRSDLAGNFHHALKFGGLRPMGNNRRGDIAKSGTSSQHRIAPRHPCDWTYRISFELHGVVGRPPPPAAPPPAILRRFCCATPPYRHYRCRRSASIRDARQVCPDSADLAAAFIE